MEPPSADERSEHMSRRKPIHHKGKAPTSSFELITLDDEHSTTPMLVTCASIPKPPEYKREDEEWHFALLIPQGLSLQENHHATSQIGGALMTEVLGMPEK